MPAIEPLCSSFGKLIRRSGSESLADLADAQVLDWFRESGALVFRGYDVDDEAFQLFSARFSSEFLQHGIQNRPQLQKGDGQTNMANVGHFPLVLHSEMSYFPLSPDLLWFYCVKPAAEDGETTLCDGVSLLNAMSPEHAEYFERHRLMYAYPSPMGGGGFFGKYDPTDLQGRLKPGDDFECETVETKKLLDRLPEFYERPVAENLRTILASRADKQEAKLSDRMLLVKYLTPAIRSTRHGGRRAFVNSALQFVPNKKFHGYIYADDGNKIPAEMIADVQEVADRLTHPMRWESGDLAMIDNSRVLHGRRAFEDTSREIHTRMSMSGF